MLSELTAALSSISFEELIVLLQEHQVLASVLIPFFAGELSVHVFGILHGSGDISLLPAVIATVSMLFFDVVIYSTVRLLQRSDAVLQRFRGIHFFTKFERFFKKYEKRYDRHPTLLLIAVKLMPMTKITIIFYALYQKMSIPRLIARDTVITVVWMIIIFLPGWLVGREFLTLEAGRHINSFVLYFVLLVVLMLLFGEQIDRVIMRTVSKVAYRFDRLRDKDKEDA